MRIFASGSIGVSNFATIAASTSSSVYLASGSSIVNGSSADTIASIIGDGTNGTGIFVDARCGNGHEPCDRQWWRDGHQFRQQSCCRKLE